MGRGSGSYRSKGSLHSTPHRAPDPEHVHAVKEAPAPSTLKQLKSFLGLVTFCTSFLPDLTTQAEPMHVQWNDTKFDWSTDCQNAFNDIKGTVTEYLQLALFNPRCETHVSIDASDVGLGASLTQMQNGVEVTVSCASHTLSSTEQRYLALEKEALGCLWVVEHFKEFLLGKHFTLHADQHALRQLLTSPAKAESMHKASSCTSSSKHH